MGGKTINIEARLRANGERLLAVVFHVVLVFHVVVFHYDGLERYVHDLVNHGVMVNHVLGDDVMVIHDVLGRDHVYDVVRDHDHDVVDSPALYSQVRMVATLVLQVAQLVHPVHYVLS